MSENLKNLENIREYLLGRISDEKELEGIEELLFSDDEFCTKAEILEDELVNDYVFRKLAVKDVVDFEISLANNSDRRLKVRVTEQIKEKLSVKQTAKSVSFFDSIIAFFSQPIYTGAFAFLLIAALIGSVFLFRPNNSDELVSLKNIYQKERPIEPRISGFDYAPLNITRGENKDNPNKNKLEEIKLELLKAVNSNTTAANYHALGVFNLTQQNYKDAIESLEKAVKLDDKNAAFHNDLGSAYFQFAKSDKDNKLIDLARANESFSKAFDLNPNSLEALFNKALTLQELNLPRMAKETWELYLQKDSTSKWADEGRKNLEKVAQMQSSFKTKEKVLDDFLTAYLNGNEEFAWKINCQTKEMISGVWLPDQLSRRYLEARKNKDESTAKESIDALTYIGNLEHDRNADFFVRELAHYYANVDDAKIDDLLNAKNLLRESNELILNRKYNEVSNKLVLSKMSFEKTGNDSELVLVAYWSAFNKRALGQLIDGSNEFRQLLTKTTVTKSGLLTSRILTSLAEIQFKKNNLTDSIKLMKESLDMSLQLGDTVNIQKNSTNLGDAYQTIGELKSTKRFLADSTLIPDLYYASKLQALRNFWQSSNFLKESDMLNSAIVFGEEALFISKENGGDVSLIFDSTLDLAGFYLSSGQIPKALYLVNQNLNLSQKFNEPEARSFAIIDSNLQAAHIYRLSEKYQQSISFYNNTIQELEKNKQYQVDSFIAHKGRLICYEKLGLENEFENELEFVSKLFEEYRVKIYEEENRGAFFDREQSVANIATNYFLKQNDSREAYEFSENSKARSLLDLLENKGFYDAKEMQIVFKESAKPFSMKKIQTLMPPNVQIIQYAVLEDKIAIWLISNNQFEVATNLISASLFEQKVQNYLDLVKEKSPQTKQISKELYDILLKPILAKLDKSKQICFVPDGILYHLPFASLVSSETEKYLIEDFALFYSPSATTSIILSEKAKTKPKTENLLAIGNPEFNRINNSTLPSLPSAEKEVSDLAKFYEKPKVLINSEAVKSNVLANFSKADIFHFAGHYIANPNSTLNSKLLLTQPTNSIDEFEGELRASEVLQIKTPNLKLAVLSACETGIERYYKGEGAIGMARTFLSIGTPIVVASQWKVESESTLELMKAFHRNRKERSLNTIEALRQAQLQMIANKDFSEPYFWSAFTAIGGNVNF
jgi:CHAT domain-containing protein